MATFHSLLKTFVRQHIAAPGPVASPITPTVIENTQRWQTHFVCPQALSTVRRLIDQDMLRWLDRQPTYVPPKLLLVVERLVPQEYGMVVLTHEAETRLLGGNRIEGRDAVKAITDQMNTPAEAPAPVEKGASSSDRAPSGAAAPKPARNASLNASRPGEARSPADLQAQAGLK
ncbi:MAG: hypothetical protein EOO39_09805, partial [Cytophagaceae bacterium]